MSQNNSFPSLPPEQLAHLLTGDGVMDALYDRAKNMMWSMVQYKEMQMLYSCALKEIQTKFEILDTEFKLEYNRNPISSISTTFSMLMLNTWPMSSAFSMERI